MTDKPLLPDGLDALADQALDRMRDRPCPPRVLIEKTEAGEWRFACPYAPEEEERWLALLFDALGTRSGGVVNHFLSTFTAISRHGEWDKGGRYWHPLQEDFDAVLAIVASLRPENEAQAAHAAQLAALNISAVKLAEQAAKSHADPRTTAILNKTVRAFGEGIERMAKIQGKLKAKTVNQTIQVIYCDNRSVNQFTGGASRNGGQVQAQEAGVAVERAALPRPCQDNREALSGSGSAREAGLPAPRRRSWLWRTFGRT